MEIRPALGKFAQLLAMMALIVAGFHKLTFVAAQLISGLAAWTDFAFGQFAQVMGVELITTILVCLPVCLVLCVTVRRACRFAVLMLCFSPVLYERAVTAFAILAGYNKHWWSAALPVLSFMMCIPVFGYLTLIVTSSFHEKRFR